MAAVDFLRAHRDGAHPGVQCPRQVWLLEAVPLGDSHELIVASGSFHSCPWNLLFTHPDFVSIRTGARGTEKDCVVSGVTGAS